MNIMIDVDLLAAKDIISILSNVATFVTAIIAIIAIFQVKKQRLSSYKPEIIVDSFVTQFYADNFLTKEDNFRFKTGKYLENNQKKPKESDKHLFVNYLLQNIGFGTAKYIEGHWEIDYKKISQVLKKVVPDNFKYGEDKDGFYFREETQNFWIFFENSSLIRKQTIDYILPESNGDNGKGHAIPDIIIKSYIYYAILKYEMKVGFNENFIYEEFSELPKPIFNLIYRDFNNKKHAKKFELNFTYCGNNFEIPNQDFNDCGIFYIDVKEK